MPGSTIRLFLVDGRADGVIRVDRPGWTGLAFDFSRSDYATIRTRPEFSSSGVYVLRGPSEASEKDTIYVGEGDVVRKRLDAHAKEKDFWIRGTAFVSFGDALNKAHLRYIEASLIRLALDAKRVEVENGTAPPTQGLSEPEAADADQFVEQMRTIFPVLGNQAFTALPTAAVPAAEPAEGSGSESVPLVLTGPQTVAAGRELADGFIVFSGATGRVETTPTFPSTYSLLRKELTEQQILVAGSAPGTITLTEDYVFKSPSAAAAVFLGGSANGRVLWRTSGGQSLKELQESGLTDDEPPPDPAPMASGTGDDA